MRDRLAGWLTTQEAAQRLGLSEASVRRLSDRGVLPGQRIGKRRVRRFRPEHVEQARAKLRENSGPASSVDGLTLGGRSIGLPIHVPALYDSDAGRVRLTVPFLAEGIAAGQPCFLIAQGEELDSYMVALDAFPGIDVDAALTSGVLTVRGGPGRTTSEALDFWERTLWEAMDRGATVIRGVGEMVSERENFESEQEMLAYEAAVNMTTRRFPCAIICQYDARKFSGRAILAAMRAHPDILDAPLSLLLK